MALEINVCCVTTIGTIATRTPVHLIVTLTGLAFLRLLFVAFGVSFHPPVKPEGMLNLETLLGLGGTLLFQPF